MESKLISVIIPVWRPNIEQLIKCLQSTINQTYTNLEIILVYRKDQKYDQAFYSLMDEYSDDKRIRILEGKKLGIANSLNEGILDSKGEIIGRIDADDYCKSDRFEKQIEIKNTNKPSVLGSWACLVSMNDNELGKIEVPVTHEQIRKNMMFHCPMLHPTLLMEKKMLKEIGLYDPNFTRAEDYELFFRAMSKGYKFENVPEHLVNIRESEESITRGSEWRSQRRNYIKAKNKAFFQYGFTRPYDVFFHLLTPFSYFVSPSSWAKIKKYTHWYKIH